MRMKDPAIDRHDFRKELEEKTRIVNSLKSNIEAQDRIIETKNHTIHDWKVKVAICRPQNPVSHRSLSAPSPLSWVVLFGASTEKPGAWPWAACGPSHPGGIRAYIEEHREMAAFINASLVLPFRKHHSKP